MKKFFSVLIFLLYASCSYAESLLEIQIPCKVNDPVKIIMPGGKIITSGKVSMIPIKTNWPAYTASKWSEPSTVCASAVNAIHILLYTDENAGRIISVIPSVTLAPAAKQGSFFAVDVPAGTGIFGGFAPLTGSRVTVLRDGIEQKITDTPHENDVLIIRSELPENPEVFMTDIENRPGGRVIAWSKEGPKVIARVVRPVAGSGRFGGSQFQASSRIRASHSGVICVSLSERDEIGGFQIIPLKHALTSKEMINAWYLTQWLIISPLPNNPDLEGKSPLYKNSLVPGTQMNDKLPDLWSTYGRKSLVLCRINGGDWKKLPEVQGRVDDALKGVTHLRIYFPFWNELAK